MTTFTHSGPVAGQYNSLAVIDCKSCGFIHLDPLPEQWQVDSLYESGSYHSEVKPEMESGYERDRLWYWMLYKDWLSLVDKIAPNRLLVDVGASIGEFVRCARHWAWDARGIEKNWRLASRYKLNNGSYRDNSDAFRSVGVISAHWVLEHLLDPSDFLAWAHSTLADKGVLLLTIPNDFSSKQLYAMNLINRPYYWLHSTHINYWNRASFSSFLNNRGFAIQHALSYGSWEPERLLMAGKNYLDDPSLGQSLHDMRMVTELAMSEKRRRITMNVKGLLGHGRDITLVAVKR